MPAAADHSTEPTSSTPSEATARNAPLFHERLLPGPAMWIIAAAVGGALGLILVPVNLTAAIVVAAVSVVAALVLVAMYSPVLEVADGRFRLSRAQIEVELLGAPQVLRDEEWARTIGQDFEPLAHHCIRGWTRTGVRVEVLDAEDPTTAWVASTRRPDDLALALRTAQSLPEKGHR